MRFLIALFALMPLTSFAYEYAYCTLSSDLYSMNGSYQSTKILNEEWVELKNDDIVFKQNSSPVSYTVQFSLDGSIYASLKLKKESVEISDRAIIDYREELRMQIEDDVKTGKVIYRLNCGLDS